MQNVRQGRMRESSFAKDTLLKAAKTLKKQHLTLLTLSPCLAWLRCQLKQFREPGYIISLRGLEHWALSFKSDKHGFKIDYSAKNYGSDLQNPILSRVRKTEVGINFENTGTVNTTC